MKRVLDVRTPAFDDSADDRGAELTLEQLPTEASAEQLVESFVPTPRFAGVSFETYRPNPEFPSQEAASRRLRDWVAHIAHEAERGEHRVAARLHSLFRRGGSRAAGGEGGQGGAGGTGGTRGTGGAGRTGAGPADGPPALYLDGGFGVGKTHLLAAAFHVAPGPKAYLSFAELAYLIGAIGMDACVEAFQRYRLICIDEFELDDVANTRLAASFFGRLLPGARTPVRGRMPVRIVTTSNTLPTELGKGRFAADDFNREIGEIAAAFDVIRIEGDDFRKRARSGGDSEMTASTATELRRAYATYEPESRAKLITSFGALTRHLSTVHPIRYAKLVEPLEAIFIERIEPIAGQDAALRFVHFIDKVYDQNVRLAFSSACPIADVFSPEYRDKGYKKKYRRALSRLHELAGEWEAARPGRRTA